CMPRILAVGVPLDDCVPEARALARRGPVNKRLGGEADETTKALRQSDHRGLFGRMGRWFVMARLVDLEDFAEWIPAPYPNMPRACSAGRGILATCPDGCYRGTRQRSTRMEHASIRIELVNAAVPGLRFG